MNRRAATANGGRNWTMDDTSACNGHPPETVRKGGNSEDEGTGLEELRSSSPEDGGMTEGGGPPFPDLDAGPDCGLRIGPSGLIFNSADGQGELFRKESRHR